MNGLEEVEKVDDSPQTIITIADLRANTFRDNGYTSVRRALRGDAGDGTIDLFEAAGRGLREALDVTAPFVVGNNLLPSREARGTIFAAHAATQGCLGRWVVAGQVCRGEITTEAPATLEQRQTQYWFGLAHKTAKAGNNPYIGASNAVHGARAERVNGLPLPMMSLWLSRGATFLAMPSAATAERLHAVRTLASHARELRSREAAMAAAKDWRRV